MKKISETDLIINPDGSVYHLNLLPGDLAETVITVGDPDRVASVSKHFDRIELKRGKREFITHTGYIGSKRVSVISTGIGTDNIDIVLNELDAVVNVDFDTRMVNSELKRLNIIRIGTSGAIQEDIPVGTIMVSEFGLGLDALMSYYAADSTADMQGLQQQVQNHFKHIRGINPYITAADNELLEIIGKGLSKGITVTTPGFYAPQGRDVRARNSVPGLINDLRTFRSGPYRITNLEMETAGIYALAKALGHKSLSVNAILASRVKFEFSNNAAGVIDETIQLVLSRLP